MEPAPAIQCPKCGHSNAEGTLRCVVCDSVISSEDQLTLTHAGETAAWSRVMVGSGEGGPTLEPGSLLAGRYEILRVLGKGGMGAVYKARDIELERDVAIKVIRPELAGDAKTLQRFKQELILARQVTHRNVIRIFDLGTHEGVKFITMEFVVGRDLSHLLEEKQAERFTPAEAVQIVRQVSRALEAAHAEGVIHRDLKPQNIIMDSGGRVIVMDFGLARSMEMSGLTRTGTVLGTPAYMSPEQAKGGALDERSDLFSLGVIFYELLTGQAPFQAETVWGTLLKRTQEPAPPPTSIVPDLPPDLCEIVLKCLATDPAQRFQTATELSVALETWLGDGSYRSTAALPALPARSAPSAPAPAAQRIVRWRWFTGAAAILLAAAGFFGWLRLLWKPPGSPKAETVLVADFNNHTGDGIFDGTLEPMLRMGLEGAGFINAYSRTTLPGRPAQATGKLDDAGAMRSAVGQGLGVVVSGTVDRQGAGYALSARVIRAVTATTIATIDATAANKDQVLYAVTKLAAGIRKALGDDTSESAQRFALETLTATSLEAVHEYAAAMEALSNGKFDEARKSFSRAVDLDANFGLAYAGMASASQSLGEHQDAEKYIKLAIAHIDHMTERERYRTRALFYILTGDQQKCVELYSALVARYSADVGAHNNLGVCYSYLRNIPKAIEEMQRASEILPKRAVYRFNLALYRSYAGEFAEAEREVRAALKLNPSYLKGYLTLAYAQLGQGRLDDAAATYRDLAKVSANGASLAASGLADLDLYQGRFREAIAQLEPGAAADLAAQREDAAADKFAAVAYAEASRGQPAAAAPAAEKAVANSKSAKIRFLAARLLVGAGQVAKAQTLAASLSGKIEPEPQSYGKLIQAEIALQQGNARRSIQLATEANQQFNCWISRFDLGRAYLEAGSLPEAESEFDRLIRRRGEAMELFMDDDATYGYFPPVYYYLGRVREGMKTSGFAESYRTYLAIRGTAGEDPLLPDLRRHTAR
jgi:tetratricopeptide (TPR) repeat protein